MPGDGRQLYLSVPAASFRSLASNEDQALLPTPLPDSTTMSGRLAGVIGERRRWVHGKLAAVPRAGAVDPAPAGRSPCVPAGARRAVDQPRALPPPVGLQLRPGHPRADGARPGVEPVRRLLLGPGPAGHVAPAAAAGGRPALRPHLRLRGAAPGGHGVGADGGRGDGAPRGSLGVGGGGADGRRARGQLRLPLQPLRRRASLRLADHRADARLVGAAEAGRSTAARRKRPVASAQRHRLRRVPLPLDVAAERTAAADRRLRRSRPGARAGRGAGPLGAAEVGGGRSRRGRGDGRRAGAARRLRPATPTLGYGQYFRTGVVLDKEHLADNAWRVAKALADSASMPLLVVATIGACAAAAVLWRARGGRVPAWRVEGAALVLACWVIAAAQLPVFVLVRHVRVNDFSVRYFSLVFVFGTLAGLLTLAGLAASLPRLARRWRTVLALAGAAGLVVGVLRVPAAVRRRGRMRWRGWPPAWRRGRPARRSWAATGARTSSRRSSGPRPCSRRSRAKGGWSARPGGPGSCAGTGGWWWWETRTSARTPARATPPRRGYTSTGRCCGWPARAWERGADVTLLALRERHRARRGPRGAARGRRLALL